MAVFDLFSKRRKRATEGVSDVYQYDEMPHALKVQFLHVVGDAFGSIYNGERYYEQIVRALTREYGIFQLVDIRTFRYSDERYRLELSNYFLEEKSVEKNIDVIELAMVFIDSSYRNEGWEANDKATVTIAEFNQRCKEQAFGYEYVEGRIIRIDSELIHSSAVLPLLTVFRRGGFDSARDEFLSAHDHYRNKDYQQALVDCLKSFESTMKIICDRRRWSYQERRGCSELIRACIDNGLIPEFWATHFAGLRSVLESGIPTPRNRIGGHGAGSEPIPQPPEELVSYVLHMTASTILFLSEADVRLSG